MDRLERIDRYLRDGLLPLWRDMGWDSQHGGVHERLTRNGQAVDAGRKRLVVQFRQLYMASHATILGIPGYAEHGARLFEWILDHGWDHEQAGWFFSVMPDGSPLDRSKDAYGHAFGLFACAWHLRASGNRKAAACGAITADLLENRFWDKRHGGVFSAAERDWRIRPGVRQQNPHMHALEGYLAMLEASGDSRFATGANRILDLAFDSFIDAEGRLREFFTEDWSPGPETGHLIEPGHHYEWAWLLHRAHRLLGRAEALEVAERLFRWAEDHGVARDGRIFDAVDREGHPVDRRQRIWPATERIKALAARGDVAGTVAAVDYLFERFRLTEDGAWIEHYGADDTIHVGDLPGTTGYHIMLALLEARALLAPAA